MASIRENTSGTHSVLFRQGRKQGSITFEDAKSAEGFKTLIDVYGVDRALKIHYQDEIEGGMTVAELADQFLAWKARDVTPRTIAQYRRDVDNWITPWLGDRAAEVVDEGDVQKWVDHMADRLSPKSVADRHMVLHSMYEYGRAKSRRLVTHNPCLETALPKRKKRPPKGMRVPEVRALLEVAAEHNPAAHDLIEFMAETGWRFSEAAALPVGAVELVDGDVWVTVTQTFQIIDDRQVLMPNEAKSWAAFRRIRLLPDSAATVKRRIVGKGPADYVFTNSRERHWNQNTFLRDTWPSLLKRAGMWQGSRKSPTPHWLRHSHVAVMVASGAQMPEIQRRIGHESIQTTINVYGGMIGDVSEDTIARAAALMAGETKPAIEGEVVAGEILELG